MKKAFLLGIFAAFFCAFSYVLNRSMHLSGGDFLWSACLRYLFSFPVYFALSAFGRGVKPVHQTIKRAPGAWFLWSTVGFGLFYVMMTLAPSFGPSFLVAGTFQVTILAGAIMTPIWGGKIPKKTLLCSCVIFAGAALMQAVHATEVDLFGGILCAACVLIAAFAYPFGNRSTMGISEGLSSIQRAYGMTLCSLPVWLVIAAAAFFRSGLPSTEQLIQGLVVALVSGVLGTTLFFTATGMVKDNPAQLAAVESLQACEVVFSLAGGVLFLREPLPSPLSFLGLILVVAGILLNGFLSGRRTLPPVSGPASDPSPPGDIHEKEGIL